MAQYMDEAADEHRRNKHLNRTSVGDGHVEKAVDEYPITLGRRAETRRDALCKTTDGCQVYEIPELEKYCPECLKRTLTKGLSISSDESQSTPLHSRLASLGERGVMCWLTSLTIW